MGRGSERFFLRGVEVQGRAWTALARAIIAATTMDRARKTRACATPEARQLLLRRELTPLNPRRLRRTPGWSRLQQSMSQTRGVAAIPLSRSQTRARRQLTNPTLRHQR